MRTLIRITDYPMSYFVWQRKLITKRLVSLWKRNREHYDNSLTRAVLSIRVYEDIGAYKIKNE